MKLILTIIFLFTSNLAFANQVIHLLSAEVRGLFGTGGLQHAVLDKAKFIKQSGHDVRIVMPFYASMEQLDLSGYKVLASNYNSYLNQGKAVFTYDIVEFSHPEMPELKVIAIKHKPGSGFGNMFHNITQNGSKVYSLHPHEGEVFAFFTKSYVTWIDNAPLNFQPDVVVLNDWHTSLASAYLTQRQEHYAQEVTSGKILGRTKKVPYVQGVIHNLRYQGIYGHDFFSWLDLDPKYFNSMDMHGNLNFLKTMMEHSDYIETVSRQYALEITTSEFGEGLESVTQKLARKGKLSGIINGIDPDKWDPQNPLIKDPEFAKLTFDAKAVLKKKNNKRVGRDLLIQKYFGEAASDNTMLIALTARVDNQKGYAYLLGEQGLFNRLLSDNSLDVKFLLAGDPHGPRNESPLVKELMALESKYPKKISVHAFDPQLERLFLYYSDFYFGGSVFEPSGLTQMFSQSVGTVPIVSRLGGHVDSVVDGKSGLIFDVVQPQGRLNVQATVDNAHRAFKRAQELTANESQFYKFRSQIMQIDNSWAQRIAYFEHFMDLASIGTFSGFEGRPNPYGSKKPVDLVEIHKALHGQGRFCFRAYQPHLGLRF